MRSVKKIMKNLKTKSGSPRKRRKTIRRRIQRSRQRANKKRRRRLLILRILLRKQPGIHDKRKLQKPQQNSKLNLELLRRTVPT